MKLCADEALLTAEDISSIEEHVDVEIQDAIEFAENSASPDTEDLTKHIYAEPEED